MSARARAHIHHAGDLSVDGILRLIEVAGRGADDDALATMCREIAAILGVDVASVYVREADTDGDDHLVLRGNHGFPARAVGAVALAIGEGLTGLCAECLRPVSVAVGPDDSHFKLIDGLGEEQFPAYLGVPLVTGGRALGVLVVQRRARVAFAPTEVALATALAAPVTLSLERRLGRAAAARSARLDGVTAVAGTAVGRAVLVPTMAALGDARLDTAAAVARLTAELERTVRRVRRAGDDEARAALDRIELVLLDARLHERVAAAPATTAGLALVARDYARAPFRIAAPGGEAVERAADVEDLLVTAGALACAPGLVPPGAAWIADRAGAALALVACARDAAAIVCEGHASAGAVAIARADRRPLVTDVRGLHAWVRPDDRVTVEAAGASAQVRINPPAVAVEAARRRRATER